MYLGTKDGKRIDKRTFKTLAGAKRARHDIVSVSGLRIFRDTEDGQEMYAGDDEWMQMKNVRPILPTK